MIRTDEQVAEPCFANERRWNTPRSVLFYVSGDRSWEIRSRCIPTGAWEEIYVSSGWFSAGFLSLLLQHHAQSRYRFRLENEDRVLPRADRRKKMFFSRLHPSTCFQSFLQAFIGVSRSFYFLFQVITSIFFTVTMTVCSACENHSVCFVNECVMSQRPENWSFLNKVSAGVNRVPQRCATVGGERFLFL